MRRSLAYVAFALWFALTGTALAVARQAAASSDGCIWDGQQWVCTCQEQPCPPPGPDCYEEGGIWYCSPAPLSVSAG